MRSVYSKIIFFILMSLGLDGCQENQAILALQSVRKAYLLLVPFIVFLFRLLMTAGIRNKSLS